MFRVRKLEIKYINDNGLNCETDEQKFTVMPICKEERNVLKTVEKYIKKEDLNGHNKRVIIIHTNKGKFYH